MIWTHSYDPFLESFGWILEFTLIQWYVWSVLVPKLWTLSLIPHLRIEINSFGLALAIFTWVGWVGPKTSVLHYDLQIGNLQVWNFELKVSISLSLSKHLLTTPLPSLYGPFHIPQDVFTDFICWTMGLSINLLTSSTRVGSGWYGYGSDSVVHYPRSYTM